MMFSCLLFQDVALDYNVMAESYETAVPWDKVVFLVRNVKHRFMKEVQGNYC